MGSRFGYGPAYTGSKTGPRVGASVLVRNQVPLRNALTYPQNESASSNAEDTVESDEFIGGATTRSSGRARRRTQGEHSRLGPSPGDWHMMYYLHHQFELGPDEMIEVILDRATNVLLLDLENYENYR